MKNRNFSSNTPILYRIYVIGLIIWLVFSSIHISNYFYSFPIIDNVHNFVYWTVINLVAPLALLFVGFALAVNNKKIASIICIILLVPLSIIFFVRSSAEILFFPTVSSYTDDLENFGVFDDRFANTIELNPVPNFPNRIPDNVYDVKYSYFYQYASSETVHVVIAWRYEQPADYSNTIALLKESGAKNTGNAFYYDGSYYNNVVVYDETEHRIAFVITNSYENTPTNSIEELFIR